MQVFMAVMSRGPSLDERFDARLDRLEDLFLPFFPQVRSRSRWLHPARRVGLWCWDNGPESIPSGLASIDSTAVTLSGYALDDGLLVGPDLLLEKLEADDPQHVIASLGGVFAICRVAGEAIHAWNTPTRLEQVYWADRNGVVVVSNRALAAHLVSTGSRRPAYAVRFMRSLLISGFPATESTPFEHVRILRPDSCLTVTAKTTRTSSLPQGDASTSDPVDGLVEALTRSVRFVPAVDESPRVALTGGKDSRLIAAVLVAAGIDFTALTGGLAEHPDVVMGRRVAAILAVPHVHTGPAPGHHDRRATDITRTVLRDACVRLFGSDGSHPVYEKITCNVRAASSDGIVLGGQGGELLRGGFAKKPATSHLDAASTLTRRVLKHADHVRPMVATRERLRLLRWLVTGSDRREPSFALWNFYLQFRAGRWAAAGWAGVSTGRTTVWPYFDATVIRAIRSLELEERISERAMAGVMERVNPQLLAVPFVGSRFAFEAKGPVDGDTAGWQSRAPVHAPPGRGSFEWRLHFSSGLGQLFTETIAPHLDDEAIRSIVDRHSASELLAGLVRGDHDGRSEVGHFMWMLFSVSLLASNLWLEPDPPLGSVRFPLPG